MSPKNIAKKPPPSRKRRRRTNKNFKKFDKTKKICGLQSAIEDQTRTGFENTTSLDDGEIKEDLLCHEVIYDSQSESSLGSINLNNSNNNSSSSSNEIGQEDDFENEDVCVPCPIISPNESIVADRIIRNKLDDSNNLNRNTVPFKVKGKRMVDMSFFLRSITSTGIHEPFDCSFLDMHPISEKREGFCTTITFQCKMCNIQKRIKTIDDNNYNKAVVSGMMSTGGGYSQLEEFSASVDMPCMSRNCWDKYHKIASESYRSAAWKAMAEAGREEARLARQAGEVDKDGYPCIAVVADGAWCKRSYKTRYDALSGVAAIVGQRTKKVLFIGVRNKYCSYCDRKKSKRDVLKPSTEHDCMKNWTGPTTAMESDAVVEGFRRSVEMHGVKYTRLIGDGDSSIHRKLIEVLPYGSELLVEKIECRNHVLRNYINRSRDLCINRKFGNVKLRNSLRENLLRLRAVITQAIKLRKLQEEKPLYVRIQELREDILNGPHHVFGDHEKCKDRGYFCDGVTRPGKSNLVPEMKNTGLFDELRSLLFRVASHASSLIWDVDNNVAELYNSYVAKLIGGKRVNYALRGSYQARCNAAVVAMNSGGQLQAVLSKEMTKDEPGHFTSKYADKKARALERRQLLTRLKPRTFTAKKTYNQTADRDYGPDAAYSQPGMSNDFEMVI